MKLKFVSELIQIASLRFIEALKGSKITSMVIFSYNLAACFQCTATFHDAITDFAKELTFRC